MAATLEELEARVVKLEAIEDVRTLLRDYAILHDQRRHKEMLELCFDKDCTVEVEGFGGPLENTVQGHDAILQFYGGERSPSDPPALGLYKHVITGSRIEVNGDEGVVVSYLNVTGGAAQDGLYQDRVRRGADGRWRFVHKRISSTLGRGVYEALDHDF